MWRLDADDMERSPQSARAYRSSADTRVFHLLAGSAGVRCFRGQHTRGPMESRIYNAQARLAEKLADDPKNAVALFSNGHDRLS